MDGCRRLWAVVGVCGRLWGVCGRCLVGQDPHETYCWTDQADGPCFTLAVTLTQKQDNGATNKTTTSRRHCFLRKKSATERDFKGMALTTNICVHSPIMYGFNNISTFCTAVHSNLELFSKIELNSSVVSGQLVASKLMSLDQISDMHQGL